MAEGFHILEHPADLGIEAWGESFGQALRQAIKGLSSVIAEPSTVGHSGKRAIEIDAGDSEQLLVRLLSEVLFCLDAEQFVTADVVFEDVKEQHLRGFLLGENLQAEKHVMKLDVKAITYHELSITQRDNRVTLRIFVDI